MGSKGLNVSLLLQDIFWGHRRRHGIQENVLSTHGDEERFLIMDVVSARMLIRFKTTAEIKQSSIDLVLDCTFSQAHVVEEPGISGKPWYFWRS
jgi:hypothetical protein